MYPDGMSRLLRGRLLDPAAKVLLGLTGYLGYNTNVVKLDPIRRTSLANSCRIPRTALDDVLAALVGEGVLGMLDGDTYVMDKSLFWKGDLNSRDALKMKDLGRTLASSLEGASVPVDLPDTGGYWQPDSSFELR